MMSKRIGRHTQCIIFALAFACGAFAQDIDVAKKLEGFDDYMATVLKDWNESTILSVNTSHLK